MKDFKTVEDMKEYGKHFRNYHFELVTLNGKKKILCGTDKVYEEDIWGTIYEYFEQMCASFGISKDECKDKQDDLVDATSEIRDSVIENFEKIFDVEFIDVHDEY